jgi:hypothetical protein
VHHGPQAGLLELHDGGDLVEVIGELLPLISVLSQ